MGGAIRLFVEGEPAAVLRNVRDSNWPWLVADFVPGEFRKDLADAVLYLEDGGGVEGWQDKWAVEMPGEEAKGVRVGYLDFWTGTIVWRWA